MPRKGLNPTPWREKRIVRGTYSSDAQKIAKANTERFRRQRTAAFKRADEIFVDGLDTGRDCRVYVLIMNRKKSGARRYYTYNSHPESDWVPTVEEMDGIWPLPEIWNPPRSEDTWRKIKNHQNSNTEKPGKAEKTLYSGKSPQEPPIIPRAPIFRL